ncbi:MAG: ABC transporter permease [Planctomycetota bacterium]|nr:ABC transporter permease [Planctomycetota bacterium]
MKQYILRRVLVMIPTLLFISILVFCLIQLPPEDIVTSTIKELEQETGQGVTQDIIDTLRKQFYLDEPMYMQYLRWMWGLVRGDFGYSLSHQMPVNKLIWDRLGYTVIIAIASIMFTWVVALPIGIYSALRQYSIMDYILTVVGLIGLATPNFMFALVLMYVGYEYMGISVGGLFSREFIGAPWSIAKIIDLLQHLWIPMVVVGTGGAAGMMRIMRANLLDELKKPYVVTARAKGVRPFKLVLKYPVRLAINPFISTIGWMLPAIFSGSAIVSVVLNLPTTGPLLLKSLMNQDMYLAGSFIMMLSVLTVIGTLISDILLAITDPRIRLE